MTSTRPYQRALLGSKVRPTGAVSDVSKGISNIPQSVMMETTAVSHLWRMDNIGRLSCYVLGLVFFLAACIGFGVAYVATGKTSYISTKVNFPNFAVVTNVSTPSGSPFVSTINLQWALLVPLVIIDGMYLVYLIYVSLTPKAIETEDDKVNDEEDARAGSDYANVYPGVDSFLYFAHLIVLPLYTAVEINILGEKSFTAAIAVAVQVVALFTIYFIFESFMGTLLNLAAAVKEKKSPTWLGRNILNLPEVIVFAAGVLSTLLTLSITISLFWPYTLALSGAVALDPRQLGAFWMLSLYFLARWAWFALLTLVPLINFIFPSENGIGWLNTEGVLTTSDGGKFFVASTPHVLFWATVFTFAGCQLSYYQNVGLTL